jgi:hypothetical protein
MAAKRSGKLLKNGKKSTEPIDGRKTLIIISDTGELYRVTNDKWVTLPDLGAQGIVKQMEAFGAYLSYVPPDIAVGFGEFCTVVNLKAILENNPPAGGPQPKGAANARARKKK